MKNSGIEWIGEIPDKWDKNILACVFMEHKQKNLGLRENNLLSLSYGKIVRKDIETAEGLLPASFETYNIIAKDDIIFRLTDLQNDQRSLRTALCYEKGIITSAYIALRAIVNVSSKYMHYLFYSYDICKVFYGLGAGIRQGMNYSDLKKLPILIPPITEQQKIAEVLDEKCGKIDKLIENEQKQIEKMKEYKQSVITSAVTKGLDKSVPMKDSGIDWIGAIPESWQLRKLNYCFDLIGSGTTPKSDNEEFYGEEIAWLQSGDINGGYVYKTEKMIVGKAIETYSALKIYQAPFLAVAMYGASVGNCSIVKLDATTNQACCVMSKSKGYLKYLFYCILAGKIALIDLAKGGTQPNISQEIIRNFRVPYPLTNEQKEIADYLDEKCGKIDEVISIKQRKIEKLQEYKKSLIYEYVTGKKEVG